MFGTDLLAELLELEIVEISEIAGGDTHRPDAEPGLEIIDAIEIAQMLQRLANGVGVVIAQRWRAALRPQRGRRKPRLEESGHAECRDQGGTGLIEQGSSAVAF